MSFSDGFRVLSAAVLFPGGIFALVLGLILLGLDRKVVARLQRRVGPPLAQPFFDTVKLLRKQTLVPREGYVPLFLGAPVLGLATMSAAPALLPIPGLYEPGSSGGDMLLFLYLMAVPGIVVMIAGSSSGSVYGSLGFSREMSLILAYEGPLLFALVAVAVFVGRASGGTVSLSLAEIVAFQLAHGPNLLQPILWPALFAYVAFLPATLGVPPFDIAEAETEVLEGPFLEYSGPPLALLKAMQALQRVVALGLGVTLFLPHGPGGLLGVVVFVAKVVVLGVVCIAVLRASVGRMRIDQALIFFLTWPEAMGLASVFLTLVTM